MWLWTALRLGSVNEAKCGRIAVTCGLIVEKYGALRAKAIENSVDPFGSKVMRL